VSVVDEVRSRLDIVDVVSGYVPLKKAGRSYKATCPFHTEKTPSFVVSPERQTWHCFGACSTGGDAFSFVMRKEGVEFGEALRLLADRTGVDLRPARPGSSDRYDALYRVNHEAAGFYQRALSSPEGSRAGAYLAERGVDEAARTSFRLGFSPPGSNRLKTHLQTLGFDLEHAVEAGLLRRADDGGIRDFFWGRLMFPIQDRRGRVIGFGGRSLDGSEPKYINTAASPVFDKRANLYGLHLAIQPIRDSNTAVVVEGYMDVIAAHQHGFHNVVASMGTALTESQVSALRNIASTFVLALDPDNAGQEATLRSLQSSWQVFERRALRAGGRSDVVFYERQPHASLKVAVLPPGKDPDLLIRESPEEWERLIAEAKALMDYLFDIMASRLDSSSGQDKLQATEALFPFITSMENPYDQDRYFRRLAELMGVSEAALEASIGRPQSRRASGGRGAGAPPRASASPLSMANRDPLEEYCLSLLLQHPELGERGIDISPDYFDLSENRDIFTKWAESTTIDGIRGNLPPDLTEHFQTLLSMENPPSNVKERAKALEEVVNRLKERFFKVQEQVLMEQLEGADWSDLSSLQPSLNQAQEINRRLKELFAGSSSETT
jgi:DNA primase